MSSEQRFPWKSDIPFGPFWSPPNNTAMAQTVFKIYTPSEISSMNLDSQASLSQSGKFTIMASILEKAFEDDVEKYKDTLSLNEKDFQKWYYLQFGISYAKNELGDTTAAEKIWRERIRV
jgi:hypothetical protein